MAKQLTKEEFIEVAKEMMILKYLFIRNIVKHIKNSINLNRNINCGNMIFSIII